MKIEKVNFFNDFKKRKEIVIKIQYNNKLFNI